jgi:hypothetical protein
VSPAEQFACEVGIQQALGKEQRDHTQGGQLHRPAAPDFRQSLVGAPKGMKKKRSWLSNPPSSTMAAPLGLPRAAGALARR